MWSGPILARAGQASATMPTTRMVPIPPPTTAMTGPSSAAAAPLSKAPSSFEKPMNMNSTASTRPAQMVWRDHLLQRSTDHHADRVERAGQEEAGQRKADVGREAEPDRGEPETRDDQQQHAARPPPRRQVGRQQGGQQCANGRGSPQDAQARRSDLEDVLGEDRQQRDGPAEQHAEQVERDRRQEDGIATDERQPGEESPDGLPLIGGGVGTIAGNVHSIATKTSSRTAAIR